MSRRGQLLCLRFSILQYNIRYNTYTGHFSSKKNSIAIGNQSADVSTKAIEFEQWVILNCNCRAHHLRGFLEYL